MYCSADLDQEKSCIIPFPSNLHPSLSYLDICTTIKCRSLQSLQGTRSNVCRLISGKYAHSLIIVIVATHLKAETALLIASNILPAVGSLKVNPFPVVSSSAAKGLNSSMVCSNPPVACATGTVPYLMAYKTNSQNPF